MNEQLEKQATELLEMLKNGIDTGVGLVQRELPIILQEVLRYYFWVNLTVAIISGVALTVCCLGFRSSYKWHQTHNTYRDSSALHEMVQPVFGCIVGLISLVFLIASVMEIIQIAVAPRLFLIEYLSHLIK